MPVQVVDLERTIRLVYVVDKIVQQNQISVPGRMEARQLLWRRDILDRFDVKGFHILGGHVVKLLTGRHEI